ncbi:hypothetical protein J2T04_002819 [Chryseobacterium lathyri]|uniref:Uncharacterized protein n=1 Tax=Chryseobacterium lathyri TaxID=395933 RepID=A0ABT9SNA5_9FLAO|nr:hypothetical protein [Chryseobacterium lathyri]
MGLTKGLFYSNTKKLSSHVLLSFFAISAISYFFNASE